MPELRRCQGPVFTSPPGPQPFPGLWSRYWCGSKARFGLGNSADIAYGGAALAGRGVVLVTINSRLGALDYLAPASLRAESDHGASDDYVTRDQSAALAWIRANVADVGENPDGVTIFGESAGS